jgi:formate dehydrogenase major subunit
MVKRIGKAGAPASRELSPDEQEKHSIAFTLDGREVRARRDETIGHAACRHGVTVPHGCLSSAPEFRPEGNCRLCVVEAEGYRALQPSCLMKASEGLIIRTDSERAVKARRTVMELLLADAAINPLSECGRVASAMGLAGSRFPPSDSPPSRDESHLGIAVHLSKCIHCMRCVQACREVEVNNVIGMAGRGRAMHVAFDFGDPMGQSTCVSCGSCAQACPTGAIAFRAPSDD